MKAVILMALVVAGVIAVVALAKGGEVRVPPRDGSISVRWGR